MAYTDDAVLAKLSALNESHDSIATAAQWIMFHRRHADRTVQLWLNRLKESPSAKRLNLIYLANEVTQQSKARHKDDFVLAFSPVVADATSSAYKGAPVDLQNKLRRVVDVWRDRGIFEPAIQAAVEARLDDLDKARGGSRHPTGGAGTGSPSSFGGSGVSIPAEIQTLVGPQQKVSKHILPTRSAVSTANQEYDKLFGPASAVPPAPVFAARLNGLLNTLATAEGAVAECVKARNELIGALEKMLNSNRDALRADEAQLAEIVGRRQEVDTKKHDVELAIVSGLSSDGGNHNGVGNNGTGASHGGNGSGESPELERPEMEALTPPAADDDEGDFYGDGAGPNPAVKEVPQVKSSPRQSPVMLHRSPPPFQQPAPLAAPGIEILSNVASQYQAVPTNGSNKRRRVESGDDFYDLGKDDGIDADVQEMLRKDSVGSSSRTTG